ncbi:MAG: dihydrolipoyllysine-residue acetyltransferase [Coxiellaceae bacterium]|nr:dihydrolipoyllysine-residue acetyltransferase [Coxiellaceae bacterium]
MAEKILVPDISGAENVDVIEVMVSVGDTVAVDDPLITLEGDKATMEVPSSGAGVVESIAVKVGDKVSEGSLILTLKGEGAAAAPEKQDSKKEEKPAEKKETSVEPVTAAVSAPVDLSDEDDDQGDVHAGPGVRRTAQEFGIPLEKIKGTGAKGRILKEDVQKYVKSKLAAADSGSSAGFGFPSAPVVDFSKFGPIDTQPLSKIKKITGVNMSRNWVTIPHVTQFDEADITELEAFRQQQKTIAAQQGLKLTPLVFIMKAVVSALHEFPQFNASLDASGENLIYKKYFNIGIAVDTPNGLVVPVIRDVDKKGMFDLAKELGEISTKAREKGLGLADMQGGCFTISSLGGIGGTAFTPIINAPEVAILGVSKSARKPIVQPNGEILPRLMLPLSLSYDHRVIDGAEAARFTVFLSSRLADIRNILL